MSFGIILVHGYTGLADDLHYLQMALVNKYGKEAITNLNLPGHNEFDPPDFDQEAFILAIAQNIEHHRNQNRAIILIGHSTGGTLILAYLAEHLHFPHLLILAGTPKKIDVRSLERWNRHREGRKVVPFYSLAKMVSLVNAMGSRSFTGSFPVHIIQGTEDSLVMSREAFLWQENSFQGPTSLTLIPGADHALFQGPQRDRVIEKVLSLIKDAHPED